MNIERYEEIKLVNSLELNTVQEAEMFVAIQSKYADNKTLDELIESFIKAMDLLKEAEQLEHLPAMEQHLAKFYKCKEMLGL